MKFFADLPPGAPPDLPFWRRPLGSLGIAFSVAVVLAQVWLIGRLTLGPFSGATGDWLVLIGPLALVGIALIVGSLIGERRARSAEGGHR